MSSWKPVWKNHTEIWLIGAWNIYAQITHRGSRKHPRKSYAIAGTMETCLCHRSEPPNIADQRSPIPNARWAVTRATVQGREPAAFPHIPSLCLTSGGALEDGFLEQNVKFAGNEDSSGWLETPWCETNSVSLGEVPQGLWGLCLSSCAGWWQWWIGWLVSPSLCCLVVELTGLHALDWGNVPSTHGSQWGSHISL